MPVSTVMALQIEAQPHDAQNLLLPYPSVGCSSAVASLSTFSARTNTCIYSQPTYDIALPDATGFLDHNLRAREISTVTKYETVVAYTGSPTQQTLAATASSSPGVDSYLGPLLGGLLGGFFGLILLVIALWYIW